MLTNVNRNYPTAGGGRKCNGYNKQLQVYQSLDYRSPSLFTDSVLEKKRHSGPEMWNDQEQLKSPKALTYLDCHSLFIVDDDCCLAEFKGKIPRLSRVLCFSISILYYLWFVAWLSSVLTRGPYCFLFSFLLSQARSFFLFWVLISYKSFCHFTTGTLYLRNLSSSLQQTLFCWPRHR